MPQGPDDARKRLTRPHLTPSPGLPQAELILTFPIDLSFFPTKVIPMPTSKQDLLDLQFIDARHKLIEVAAFLDRIDRHEGDPDYRIKAYKDALPLLLEQRKDRARAILEALSDQSTELSANAPFQGAFGAPLPRS